MSNTKSAMLPVMATKRLQQDYLAILKDPISYFVAKPLPSNILEWHYVLRGTKESPYEGGIYHGKLIFPEEYPFKPPSIYMITPNGRFLLDTKLCLSISNFHPESWRPSWTVSSLLIGFYSFMLENTATLGSTQNTTLQEKRKLASESGKFNLGNPLFCKLFPEIVSEFGKNSDKKSSDATDSDLSDEAGD